jgi:hypothetical protein
MRREVRMDKAFYLVDDSTRTFYYLRKNPDWEKLGEKENEYIKRQLDGYYRVLKDGKKKPFYFAKGLKLKF